LLHKLVLHSCLRVLPADRAARVKDRVGGCCPREPRTCTNKVHMHHKS
jgi:hypothetical protein